MDPPGFVKIPSGYTTKNTAMQHWNNVDDVEFVDFGQWLSYRCGVSSISGTTVTMQEPCRSSADIVGYGGLVLGIWWTPFWDSIVPSLKMSTKPT